MKSILYKHINRKHEENIKLIKLIASNKMLHLKIFSGELTVFHKNIIYNLL